MKNVKLINYDLIMVSVLLVSTLVTSFNIVVLCSSQPELMNCYPESEDRDAPTVFEPAKEHEIYAYVQEGDNASRIKVDILALDGVPHRLRLVSNWNVTWYQITTYIDAAMIERPYFLKSLANTTWSELNWRHDWGVDKIIGNHTDMVAFKAVGKVEVAYESVVVIEMMSNDGMLVSLNGAILKPNMWFPHERMREEHRVLLHVGLHDVEVLWFEKDGEAFSEFKMYPIGWSVEETIHLSRGEIRADPEYGSCNKYNATWESNFLLGQNYQFNWILEDEKGNFFDEKTTYVHLHVPIDGDFTINGVVVQNATFKVSKPNIEFWFYSKSRGDEVSSVIIEVSDDNGLLPDPNGRILLTEIEQDKVWYGSCTLQRDGEFSLMGYFHTVREEEWVKMSVDLQYKTELSSVQIRFLINGITIVLILVLGYSIFYLGRWLTKYEQIKS